MLRQSLAQRLHNEELDEQDRQAKKRASFSPPALNEFGLPWADGTRARILIKRGDGVIVVDDMRITPHPYDTKRVEVTRPGGGYYAVSDADCPCAARSLCRHREAVKFAGNVEAIRKAYRWLEETKDESV